jgi:predicted  nucleic acid-binding Zn-ribbon protein
MEYSMNAVKEELLMEIPVTQLESRVTRIEVQLTHLISGMAETKTQLHDFRKWVEAKFDETNSKSETKVDGINVKFAAVNSKIDNLQTTMLREFDNLNATMIREFGRLRLWTVVVVGGGILTIVAR